MKKAISLLLAIALLCSVFTVVSAEPIKIPANRPHAVGTFVQPYLYSGWTEKMADEEFTHMKEMGMEYLIMGDSVSIVHKDKKTTYELAYPSTVEGAKDYADKGMLDRVDMILKYCDKYGIKCYLGIGNQIDEYLWYFYNAGQREDYLKFCDFCCKTATDLYQQYKAKYPNAFYGFYYVPEMWNNAYFDSEKSRNEIAGFVSEGFNTILTTINGLDPKMPLLFSPFANISGWNGSLDGTVKFYTEFLKKTNFRNIDILCPQDSIGAGGMTLDKLEEWTKGYKDAITASGSKVRYWANCEDFTIPQDGVDKEWMTADVKRFIKQMDIVSKYVENIITFAYPHYYSTNEALPGFEKAYRKYLETGETDTVAPTAPAKVLAERKDSIVDLTWVPSTDEYDIALYNIYVYNPKTKSFSYCGRKVATRGGGGCEPDSTFSMYSETTSSELFAIEAMDCAGNYSKKIIVEVKDGSNGVDINKQDGATGILTTVDDLAAYAKSLNEKPTDPSSPTTTVNKTDPTTATGPSVSKEPENAADTTTGTTAQKTDSSPKTGAGGSVAIAILAAASAGALIALKKRKA